MRKIYTCVLLGAMAVSAASPAVAQNFTLPMSLTPTADEFARFEEYHTGLRLWEVKDGYMNCDDATKGNNAWVFIPVEVSAIDNPLTFSVEARASRDSYVSSFEVMVGASPQVDAMTQQILSETTDDSEWLTYTKSFTSDITGTVWLGIHNNSPSGNRGLQMRNIELKASAAQTVVLPASPVIKSSEVTGLNYTATVTMPAKDTEGNAISSEMALKVIVDGDAVETKTGCAAGSEVVVTLTLEEGIHTIGYKAVLGDSESQIVSEVVEATAPVADVYSLPFSFVASEATFKQCSTVDANGDEEDWSENGIWTYKDDAFTYTYHGSHNADDWLILPPVDFGQAAKVTVSLSVKSGGYNESFEVFLGNGSTVAAMTVPVLSRQDFKTTSYTEVSAEIAVPAGASTNWCVGIHATSPADQYTLSVQKVTIVSADVAVIVPANPAIKESNTEYLDYTATVTVPAVDTDGNAIEDEIDLEIYVDGVLTDTKTGCAAGSEVAVSLTLEAGSHTIGYQAVLGDERSELVTETVEAVAEGGGDISDSGLPFSFVASAETFAQCLTVDANGDAPVPGTQEYLNQNGVWSLGSTNAAPAFKYTYSMNNKADDWLIMPMVDFGTYTKVKISVDVQTAGSDDESFEIRLGNERAVDAMTVEVLSREGYKHPNSYETLVAEVVVPVGVARDGSNEWALGIHAVSEPFKYNLYVNNISIEGIPTTGIDDIDADDDAACEYYNLQGMRVDNPVEGSVVIVRKGGKTFKTVVR